MEYTLVLLYVLLFGSSKFVFNVALCSLNCFMTSDRLLIRSVRRLFVSRASSLVLEISSWACDNSFLVSDNCLISAVSFKFLPFWTKFVKVFHCEVFCFVHWNAESSPHHFQSDLVLVYSSIEHNRSKYLHIKGSPYQGMLEALVQDWVWCLEELEVVRNKLGYNLRKSFPYQQSWELSGKFYNQFLH